MVNALPQQREFAFDQEHFTFLARLAHAQTGIVLAEHKRDMVYGRLARRLRALGMQDFSEYCELLQSEDAGDEIGNLINAITTNLTSFFREGHHFEHLKNTVLAPLAKSGAPQKLRLWSAAASSGMEPYSMAMTLREAIPNIDTWDARILATDIDSNMLATGAKGEYRDTDIDAIPRACQRYVQPASNGVRMSPELKRLIAFKQLNLLESWPMKGRFDVVFCRNVVIYFDKPTKIKLFDRIAGAMQPGGWLYIGHSENLHGITDRFELCGRTTYRKVK